MIPVHGAILICGIEQKEELDSIEIALIKYFHSLLSGNRGYKILLGA